MKKLVPILHPSLGSLVNECESTCKNSFLQVITVSSLWFILTVNQPFTCHQVQYFASLRNQIAVIRKTSNRAGPLAKDETNFF
jgi:hypothetical protein